MLFRSIESTESDLAALATPTGPLPTTSFPTGFDDEARPASHSPASSAEGRPRTVAEQDAEYARQLVRVEMRKASPPYNAPFFSL